MTDNNILIIKFLSGKKIAVAEVNNASGCCEILKVSANIYGADGALLGDSVTYYRNVSSYYWIDKAGLAAEGLTDTKLNITEA